MRTALEDRMLRRGLAGYPDYARRVRWRLVPGVWWARGARTASGARRSPSAGWAPAA